MIRVEHGTHRRDWRGNFLSILIPTKYTLWKTPKAVNIHENEDQKFAIWKHSCCGRCWVGPGFPTASNFALNYLRLPSPPGWFTHFRHWQHIQTQIVESVVNNVTHWQANVWMSCFDILILCFHPFISNKILAGKGWHDKTSIYRAGNEKTRRVFGGLSEGFRMAFGRFSESFRKAFGSRSEGCKNVKSNLAIFWQPGPYIHQC